MWSYYYFSVQYHLCTTSAFEYLGAGCSAGTSEGISMETMANQPPSLSFVHSSIGSTCERLYETNPIQIWKSFEVSGRCVTAIVLGSAYWGHKAALRF